MLTVLFRKENEKGKECDKYPMQELILLVYRSLAWAPTCFHVDT
jgi:hypothetical protein